MSLGRRRAQIFGKKSEDQKGTTELYPLFSTFPWHLIASKDPRCTSSFLYLHFITVGLIGLLLFVYSLLAAWPLVNTATANGYPNQFTIQGIEGKVLTCDKLVR